MNWIDLFNIGNVMLMRGQDLQVSHLGTSEIGEVDSLVDLEAIVSGKSALSIENPEQSLHRS
jgi:hypothetical protein